MNAKVISKHRAQNQNNNVISKKRQAELDHEEHYDLDGVTQENGKISLPEITQTKRIILRKGRILKSV